MSEGMRLGDHCLKIGSGATPRGGKDSYLLNGPFTLIRSQNVYNTGFAHDGLAFISEDQASKLKNVEVEPEDILVNITGDSVARVCQVDPKVLPSRVNQHVAIVRPDSSKIDPAFLRYWLVAPSSQQRLLSLASAGATRNALTKSMLEDLIVPDIDLSDQIAIGNTLARLDEGIELNRQINETLEAIAQAIFHDWFIDFGPVRRKMEGLTDPVKVLGGLVSDQAQAENVAALFPHDLSSEGVPKGWSIRTLEDALTLAYGKALPKTARINGPFPVYGSGGIGGSHSAALAQGPGVIVGRKGTVGSLFWEAGDFYAIDTVFYVQPKEGFSLEYLWQLLRTLGLEKMNTDAAVPGLNRNNAYRLEVVFSDQPTRNAFTELAKSLRNRIDAAEAESRTLAETRDYLLPRLMSGKVVAREPEGDAS